MQADIEYLRLCQHIIQHGQRQSNRTGVDTISAFGWQSRYDLRQGFPILTTKKVDIKAVAAELLWFLGGDMNLNKLEPKYQFIWKAWSKEDGDLGPIYGHQFRKWRCYDSAGHVDQIQNVIDQLKQNPFDRRAIVSAWNAADLSEMALPPCHVMFQLKASYATYEEGIIHDSQAEYDLDLMMFQRSCDVPVGVPFNVASYALLLSMFAKELGMRPRYFIHSMGDIHIYVNQLEGIKEQLRRDPKDAPTLSLADKPFWAITLDDISLQNYEHHPFIRFPVAV